jgi:transcription antitermination factor NusG
MSGHFPSDDFQPGDKVSVVDGTFAGLEGTILSDEEVRRRGFRPPPPSHIGKLFWVLLPVLGRDVPVDLEPHQFRHA